MIKKFFLLVIAYLLSINSALGENFLDLYKDSANSTTNNSTSADSWLSDKNSHNAPTDFLSVDQAFIANLLQDEADVQIVFDIATNYYLYMDSIKLINNSNGENLSLKLPQAIAKTDKFYGDTKIYKDQLVVNLAKSQLTNNSIWQVKFQGCAEAGLCYPPQTKFLQLDANSKAKLSQDILEKSNRAIVKETQLTQNNLNSTGDKYANALANKGILTILAIFFVGGLLLAFTPCVLPMLPIISALVVGKNKTKFQALQLSFAYVVGMALSYAMLGGLSGLLGGFLNLQTALQSAWVLVPFAIFFVILSLSLFGLFELKLPNSWQEKIIAQQNKVQGKGGLITSGVVGFLAALVVSPCLSAPLVAGLSFVAQSGNAGIGALALFASGLGIGLPLMIFATLGAAYLPKSGAWLLKVKHIFGISMLFMALYMVRLWLDANIILLVSGILLLFVAGIFFAKKTPAFIASLLVGIYALALIIGGLMGNSDFFKPLELASKTSQNHTASNKQWLEISEISQLDAMLQNTSQQDASQQDASQQDTSQEKPNLNLVLISASWCANCKIIAKQMLEDAQLIAASKNWRLIKLDTTNPDAKMQEFLQAKNIFGPPSFLFYKGQEEVQNLRLQGIIDKLAIMQRLSKAESP